MTKSIQLQTGQKFNRLTVINFQFERKNHKYYLCQCDCGKNTIVERSSLIRGNTKSCGCFKKEYLKTLIDNPLRKIHGGTGSRIFNIWRGIKSRCYNKNNQSFSRNRRTNHFIDYNGEIHCISEWAEILNIDNIKLYTELSKYNWSLENFLNNFYKNGKNIR